MCPKNLLHQERSGRFQLCLKGLRGYGFPELTTWLIFAKLKHDVTGEILKKTGKEKKRMASLKNVMINLNIHEVHGCHKSPKPVIDPIRIPPGTRGRTLHKLAGAYAVTKGANPS
jgi:hypothetical protein